MLGGQGIVCVNGKNRNQLEKDVLVSKPGQMYKSSYYIVLCVCLSVLNHLGFLGHIWHAEEGFPCSVPAFAGCLSKQSQRIIRNGQKHTYIREAGIKTLMNLGDLDTVRSVNMLQNFAFLEQCFPWDINSLFSELNFQSFPAI